MALLAHKTFSDALTGANGFDSVNASNATIAQSAGAGLHGTSGGVTVARTANTPDAYGRLTSYSFSGKTILRSAWWTDLSALTIGTNGHAPILFRYYSAANIVALVAVVKSAGSLLLRNYLYNDSGTLTFATADFGLPQWMEARIQRASDGSTADGSFQLYCGGGDYAQLGELVVEVSNILCYTRFEADRLLIGIHQSLPSFVTTSVGGSIVVDEWSLRDDDTPILYGVSVATSGRPYDLDQLLDLTTIRM